jgi:hypothetical protein
MSAVVPSYVAKISRAEKHRVELHEAIAEYAARKPYTVRKGIEGKKKKTVHRLVFTADPANTDIPIIAADIVYNLRSGLDHLMSGLVANKKRSRVIFPIFFQGVWEPSSPREDAQRRKLRERWTSDTKTVKAPALTILKALQPPDGAGDGMEADRLSVLNSLSNRDRHEKLPVLVSGLADFTFQVVGSDGIEKRGIPKPGTDSDFAHNDARLRVPEDAVKVDIEGTPVIVIRVAKDELGKDRFVRLLTFLDEAIPFVNARIINPLIPHVRR